MTGDQTIGDQPLTEAVRSAYLGRLSGTIEFGGGGHLEGFDFRRGELYVSPSHPWAPRFKDALRGLEDDGGQLPPAAFQPLREALLDLAHRYAPWALESATLQTSSPTTGDLIGPLPTVLLVMELAVYRFTEEQLLESLGGDNTKYMSHGQTPAMWQLPQLEPEMAQVLTRLETPASPMQIRRGFSGDPVDILRGLAKLRAVGLVTRTEESRQGSVDGSRMVTAKLLRRFLELIENDLEASPVALPVEEHRTRVAELLGRLGAKDHYELLQVSQFASEQEIHRIYQELARLAHPSQAERIGMVGKEPAMQVLFELATEAYLTLSDPKRRSSYNMVAGVHQEQKVDLARRAEEKRRIAKQNYVRATSLLGAMDYSLAVDLLKEAVRLDPQADYYVLLGRAQAKNPNWHNHALDSFLRALQRTPKDAGVRSELGDLLEQMGRLEEARDAYLEAVDIMPGFAHAESGLARLREAGISTSRPLKSFQGFKSFVKRRPPS